MDWSTGTFDQCHSFVVSHADHRLTVHLSKTTVAIYYDYRIRIYINLCPFTIIYQLKEHNFFAIFFVLPFQDAILKFSAMQVKVILS